MTTQVPKRLRQPIVVVLGHVDHGKTTLLDKIRGTAVVKKEPGEMTQEVGASFVPTSVIEKISEPLKKSFPIKLEIPGLLFIDTPGHELFSNLRKRGGSVADIAILVVDIVEGIQKQTLESIEILKSRKVPFIVAANKIDRINGWKAQDTYSFLESINKQEQRVRDNLDKQVYNLVIQLAEQGFNAERFDRIRDFTKTVAIIPVSAKTGEGIAEVLAILAGLTQNYMKNKLKFAEGPAKGVILEVKELQGLGYTADVVIYEGILRKNDIIVLAGIDGPIVTKVRAILVPRPLQDIKLAKSDLAQIDEVYAASGVKVYAQNLETALAGSPIYVAENNEEVEKYKKIIQEEVSAVRYYNSSVYGIIVKADSLGSLEAIVSSLERRNIPIRLADIGPISKRDITEAEIVAEKAKEYGIIAAFRVKPLSGIEIPEKIKLISDDIIYQLMDNIEKYIEDIKESEKRKTLETIVLPGKIKIIPGYVFRRSDPVIVGVEVLGGIIRPKYGLIKKDGRRVGEVLQIQDNKKSVDRASKGMEVAVSIKGNIMVGRQVEEGEVLYTDVPKEDLQILMEKYKDIVTDDMIEVIKEIIRIKRTQDATYGLGLQFQ
ncbi:translation initiation factor IF-2 [Sulfolobus acidocaldarius]|uniref:Probable translation initiation factor IF-2 n=4 Tax=Sulfolobus acidocaldarius TaxID=2285 RepID=IF2P_SULAC|nr:translation initiation factor IF-2 [Sulfolobus acidocaldarius]P95691.2 RecName: Full=Probable translation initiation factor IF-2 [Sulfolobus acidocaldarius DSM 639]AAY80075.1 translation initiation factor 2-like protein [Sulfolobus acidocaldarius DSM 639]AGE70644.1 translation initiation factor IF-2 [Sulfolobus acidocaldarius N8]AGE72917.1 translation initiation factor IF-2 [Sulfolobus acidocaldarius Ron12/I]ALU29007.1 translation initiation factor IF-2 [Sulfolobus acidocaldarius]ALU31734.